MLSPETLKYKERPSQRSFCAHCKAETQHKALKDPNMKKWVEICLECEMVELADDELQKIGKSYKRMSEGKRRGTT